jgi:hypothetical protein
MIVPSNQMVPLGPCCDLQCSEVSGLGSQCRRAFPCFVERQVLSRVELGHSGLGAAGSAVQ